MEEMQKKLKGDSSVIPDFETERQVNITPRPLTGCILSPKMVSTSDSENDDDSIIEEGIEFENPRQKLKHYLLKGKKLYVGKVTGHVFADIPPEGIAVTIPPGKFSIKEYNINSINDENLNDNSVDKVSVDNFEKIIFPDDRIRTAINEILSDSSSENKPHIKSENTVSMDSSQEETVPGTNITEEVSEALLRAKREELKRRLLSGEKISFINEHKSSDSEPIHIPKGGLF